MAGMLEYKCPCCDGAIQFDSATQKMKCPYCDTEFDVDTLKHPMKQRFSKRTRLVSALLTLAMVFTFLPLSALAANTASTEIDFNSPDFALEFPDAEFRRFLRDCCDTNYDGKLDVDIKSMTIPTSYEIKSLKGIQLFEALEKLDCHGIGLTTLNVSMNFKLKELDCSGNQLKEYLPILSSGLKKLNCSKVKKIQKDLENKQKELDDLKAETILVIRGVSALDKELLGTLVAEAREALETLEKQLVQAQEEYEEATKTAKRSNYICNELFTWADVYDTANHDERRAILQQFIKEIRVRKDYEISITLNASFNQVEQLKAVSTYDGAEIFEEISEKGA